MVKNVAYPDWIMDDKLLDQYHAKLSILASDNWIKVLEKINHFNVQMQLNKLLKPTDRKWLEMVGVFQTNALLVRPMVTIFCAKKFCAAGIRRSITP